MGILEDLAAELPERAKALRKIEQERTGSTQVSDSMENVLRGMGLGHLLEQPPSQSEHNCFARIELNEMRRVIRSYGPKLPEDFTPADLQAALETRRDHGIMQWVKETEEREREKDELTRLIVVFALPALDDLFELARSSELRGGQAHQRALYSASCLRHGLKEVTGVDVYDPQSREAFLKKITS